MKIARVIPVAGNGDFGIRAQIWHDMVGMNTILGLKEVLLYRLSTWRLPLLNSQWYSVSPDLGSIKKCHLREWKCRFSSSKSTNCPRKTMFWQHWRMAHSRLSNASSTIRPRDLLGFPLYSKERRGRVRGQKDLRGRVRYLFCLEGGKTSFTNTSQGGGEDRRGDWK